LIDDIANLPVGHEQCANGFRVSDCVDLSFIQRQSKLPCWKYTPGNVPARIYTVRSQNSIGKDKWRGSHSRYANTFSAEILRSFDVAIDCRLDPEATSMDRGCEFYIKALLNRFANKGGRVYTKDKRIPFP
jgi:hypothetical protein